MGSAQKSLFSSATDIQGFMQQAKRNAVLAALDKVVGAGTRNNPKVQEQLEELIVQVGEQVFYDPMPDMVGDTYRMNITRCMDDKQLRSVISDLAWPSTPIRCAASPSWC